MSYQNELVHLGQNFDFQNKKGTPNKFPISVASMSR